MEDRVSSNSRKVLAAKNVLWGYVGTFMSMFMAFIARTVFIYTIGSTYLGINGLFTNVLGILSFTELGIGTAINFSLYKPVAEKDLEKIKSLMCLYKRAYRVIALVVTILGLSLLPFLPYLINGAKEIENISLYYLIFLFNSVSSYFVTYKYGLVNAEQKNYLLTNINTVSTVIISIIQIIVLVLFENFLVYLLVQAILQLIQKIFTAFYINKKYPYLTIKNAKKLKKTESKKILTDIRALVLHKIGDISINQSDNIIISAFINVTLVGLVSNYNLLITSVTTLLNIVFNSIIGSLGNFVVTETKTRQIELASICNFIGFWVYGFSAICFIVLFQPFITLWIGSNQLIDNFTMILIVMNFYFAGQRATIHNFKLAGGIFKQDQFIPIIQSVINIIFSILFVQTYGLAGVYIGTFLSSLLPNFYRPYVVYKYLFETSIKIYLKKYIREIVFLSISVILIIFITRPLAMDITWMKFFLLAILTVALSNLLIVIVYRKTPEMEYLRKEFLKIIERIKYGKSTAR